MIKMTIIGGLLGTVALIFVTGGLYTVPEGNIGVEKTFSRATSQEGPGLHVKWPLVQSVETIEVRERKNVEQLAAATSNQLPVTADVSLNWTVDREAAMDLFIQYGSLAQFESRVLDPKLRSAGRAAISRFAANEIIRDRNAVIAKITEDVIEATLGLPINISQVQLENVVLPEQYMSAILAKEKAREDAIREEHTLVQQKLKAQQIVQTAEADRDALKARAEGSAFKTLTEAKAQAEAIKLVTAELAKSPLFIEYQKAVNWNGVLPTTMLNTGEGGMAGSFLLPIGR